MKLFFILISAMLINNLILSRFLGICPFLGVSRKLDTAVGMGISVIFVMILSSTAAWFIDALLKVWGIEYLKIITFILVIAALVQLVEIFMKKASPTLYEALGIYLPLITTNCAILGIALLNSQLEYNFLESLVNAIGASVGFALALVIFASIRERLEFADIPKPFAGMASVLIAASLLSMAFMGFKGLVKM
ncbi:MAG: electron transport complex subunit RsxA [Thermotogae bacterium]|nr:electron transport complex subunit RsxA [Thermotogota bacterium]